MGQTAIYFPHSVNDGEYQGNRSFQGDNNFPIVGKGDLWQYNGRCDSDYRCEGRTNCQSVLPVVDALSIAVMNITSTASKTKAIPVPFTFNNMAMTSTASIQRRYQLPFTFNDMAMIYTCGCYGTKA